MNSKKIQCTICKKIEVWIFVPLDSEFERDLVFGKDIRDYEVKCLKCWQGTPSAPKEVYLTSSEKIEVFFQFGKRYEVRTPLETQSELSKLVGMQSKVSKMSQSHGATENSKISKLNKYLRRKKNE
jgi:deoxyribodipyrimidine photolyase